MDEAEIAIGIMLGVITPVGPNALIVHDRRRRWSSFRMSVPTQAGNMFVVEYCLN